MADKWGQFAPIPSGGPLNIVKGTLKLLDKAVGSLSKTLGTLTKLLKALQFFISSFSSFSAILASFVNFAQKQISQFTGDIVNAGIYLNILIPPSFLKALSPTSKGLDSGGFKGFLSRLKVSLNNTSDKNAPNFSDDAQVGGFLIVYDTESLEGFFRGLEFLTGMFDFFKLFPINTAPLPPRNVKAVSGYFNTPDLNNPGQTIKKLGVKLTWEAPSIAGFTNYRISRSQKAGGEPTITHPVPTKLIGPKGREEEGLLKAAYNRLVSDDPIVSTSWPPVTEYKYDDPDFNSGTGNPVIVRVNPINGNGGYIDYDIDPEAKNSKFIKYYYVVESGFYTFGIGTGFWGPRTPETTVAVNLKGCINPDAQAVVMHPANKVEFVHYGVGGLGQWSSIRVGGVLPFMDTLVGILNKFLAGLAGALKTNTKSFTDFLKGIVTKVKNYQKILKTLVDMIIAIENFFSKAPAISFLNIPPAAGGLTNFMRRIENATQPPGGFSGLRGKTCGIVFVYGAPNFNGSSLTEAEKKSLLNAYNAQSSALGKAFGLLLKILGS